jgi:hypothetical protein
VRLESDLLLGDNRIQTSEGDFAGSLELGSNIDLGGNVLNGIGEINPSSGTVSVGSDLALNDLEITGIRRTGFTRGVRIGKDASTGTENNPTNDYTIGSGIDPFGAESWQNQGSLGPDLREVDNLLQLVVTGETVEERWSRDLPEEPRTQSLDKTENGVYTINSDGFFADDKLLIKLGENGGKEYTKQGRFQGIKAEGSDVYVNTDQYVKKFSDNGTGFQMEWEARVSNNQIMDIAYANQTIYASYHNSSGSGVARISDEGGTFSVDYNTEAGGGSAQEVAVEGQNVYLSVYRRQLVKFEDAPGLPEVWDESIPVPYAEDLKVEGSNIYTGFAGVSKFEDQGSSLSTRVWREVCKDSRGFTRDTPTLSVDGSRIYAGKRCFMALEDNGGSVDKVFQRTDIGAVGVDVEDQVYVNDQRGFVVSRYDFTEKFANSGSYSSNIEDLGQIEELSYVAADSSLPPGNSANVTVRFGNSSDLSSSKTRKFELSGGYQTFALNGNARYIEISTELSNTFKKKDTPVLDSVAVNYGATAAEAGLSQIALGENASATAKDSVAIGSNARAGDQDTASFGSSSDPLSVDVTGDLNVEDGLVSKSKSRLNGLGLNGSRLENVRDIEFDRGVEIGRNATTGDPSVSSSRVFETANQTEWRNRSSNTSTSLSLERLQLETTSEDLNSEFSVPAGLEIKAVGDEGVYTSKFNGRKLRKFDRNGNNLWNFTFSTGVEVVAADGNKVYVNTDGFDAETARLTDNGASFDVDYSFRDNDAPREGLKASPNGTLYFKDFKSFALLEDTGSGLEIKYSEPVIEGDSNDLKFEQYVFGDSLYVVGATGESLFKNVTLTKYEVGDLTLEKKWSQRIATFVQTGLNPFDLDREGDKVYLQLRSNQDNFLLKLRDNGDDYQNIFTRNIEGRAIEVDNGDIYIADPNDFKKYTDRGQELDLIYQKSNPSVYFADFKKLGDQIFTRGESFDKFYGYSIQKDYSQQGSYESRVFDVGEEEVFPSFDVDSEVPNDLSVNVTVNLSDTSDFSSIVQSKEVELSGGKEEFSLQSDARYARFEASLSGNVTDTPRIDSVGINYGNTTLAEGINQIALGRYANATSKNSVAIGFNSTNNQEQTALIGNSYEGQRLNLNVTGNLTVHQGLDVKGTKNFVEGYNETHDIVYTSSESGEAVVEWTDSRSVSTEGTRVALPHHLLEVMSGREDYHVIATPVNSLADVGVFNKTASGFTLKASGDTEVDLHVRGVRKDYSDKKIFQR